MAVVLGTNAGFLTVAPTADPSGTNFAQDTYSFATKDTAPTGATKIIEIGWWCDNATEESNFEVGLYNHDVANNIPESLLFSSATNAKGTTSGWKSVVVDWDITAGTVYWLAVQLDDTATTTNNNYTIGAGRYASLSSSTSLPASWTHGNPNGVYTWAIYAVYSTTTYVEITGTITGTSTVSGILDTSLSSVNLEGTITGTSTVSGTLDFSMNWNLTDYEIIKRLVTFGNNEVWYEDITVGAGIWKELTAASGDIDTSKQIWAFEAFGKVFVVNGANRKVADFINVKITTTDIGANPPDFQNVLTETVSGAKMIVDYITSLSGACTIYGRRITTATFAGTPKTISGTDDDGNGISFTAAGAETAGPHWYNWTVYGNSATYGTMPDHLTLGCLWNGRPVVSGNEDDPNQWYMFRQGCPWDLNYIANDQQAPISGEDAEPGKVGDAIIALIPYSKDYFVIGCANSFWYIAGIPAAHGALMSLDDTCGILDSQAWCKDKEDNLYVLATTGLLKIPNGFGQPQNLLEFSYPDFIKDFDFDGSLHRAILGFDRKHNGIKIVKTTLTTGVNSCYWYDLRTGGLFPETYPNECGPYCLFDYAATDAGYSGLMHGCKDGYVRVEEDGNADDDTGVTNTAIDSYVTFGPIALAGQNREGTITSIVGITTGGGSGGTVTDSNDLTYKAWVGLSSDYIVEKLTANTSPNIAGIIVAPGRGRGARKRKTMRGVFAGIRIGNNTPAQKWGLEKLIIEGIEKGRIK